MKQNSDIYHVQVNVDNATCPLRVDNKTIKNSKSSKLLCITINQLQNSNKRFQVLCKILSKT